MTQLRVGTADLTLALWMFVAGLGIGPTFAVFTIIVQNAVPFNELGAATSDLTLFRQIGTTVGIAVAFTIFRLNFTWDLLARAARSPRACRRRSSGGAATRLRSRRADQSISGGGSARLPARDPAGGAADLRRRLPPGADDLDREQHLARRRRVGRRARGRVLPQGDPAPHDRTARPPQGAARGRRAARPAVSLD